MCFKLWPVFPRATEFLYTSSSMHGGAVCAHKALIRLEPPHSLTEPVMHLSQHNSPTGYSSSNAALTNLCPRLCKPHLQRNSHLRPVAAWIHYTS